MAKSKYETHVLPHLERIERWVKMGATQGEVAKKLNISRDTLNEYIRMGRAGDERFSGISDAYARACEVSDDEVEASLYKLANGYTAQIAKTFKVKVVEYDEATGRKIREYEELRTGMDEVHVPANVTAQMFWLANRVPGRWKYKPEPVDNDGETGTGVVMLPPVMGDPGPPKEDGHE